jgi:hypothetical protein
MMFLSRIMHLSHTDSSVFVSVRCNSALTSEKACVLKGINWGHRAGVPDGRLCGLWHLVAVYC